MNSSLSDRATSLHSSVGAPIAPNVQPVLAAIDIGTNSIHMVVVRIDPSLPAFTIIAREKSTVRLGDRDPKTGELTPAAIDRALGALRRCRDLAASLEVREVVAVATSAVRESPNGRDFIKQVRREIGISINLISGPEEARRIYLGVLSGMEFHSRPHVIIDIGGGSTELILGDGQDPRHLSSTKVGAVRLTAEFVTTDPIAPSELNYLYAYVRGMLERPIEEIHAHLQPGETPAQLRLVGTSGTAECLAAIHAAETLGTVPDPLHGYELPLDGLRQVVQRLSKMTYAQRAELPGMNDRRAEIIVAGAVVLLEAMEMLGVRSLVVCERALREGVVVDWMLTHNLIADRLRFQSSVRERSTLALARKYRVNLDSAQRVATFALTLFDQTRDLLHPWGDAERELLWAAAILHNCGHHVSHAAHHKHAYYLIRNGELLGFTETEIETIANLARYHRKSAPKKRHEGYQNLAGKRYRQIVDELSPLLRIAAALDRRQIGAVAHIQCQYNQDQYNPNAGPDANSDFRLLISPARPEDECAIERWGVDYEKHVFEQQFSMQLIPTLEGGASSR